MDLSIEGHVATASKDRTGLFDGSRLTPDSHTGRKLLAWLESYEIPTNLGENPGLKNLMETFGQLGIDDLHDEYAAYVCERYGISGMDEMSASQTSEQSTMLKQCLAREEKLSQFVDILRQRKLAA